MLGIYVPMTRIGWQMGRKLASLFFGKAGSARRPMTFTFPIKFSQADPRWRAVYTHGA